MAHNGQTARSPHSERFEDVCRVAADISESSPPTRSNQPRASDFAPRDKASTRAPRDKIITQDSVAELFAEQHKNDLRFCHSMVGWFRWTGSRGRRDEMH